MSCYKWREAQGNRYLVLRRCADNRLGISASESLIKAIDQFLVIEWLAQKSERTCRKRLRAGSRFGIGRNENDRQAVPLRNQPTLQLNSAHSRHLHIRDKACSVMDAIELRKSSADTNVAAT